MQISASRRHVASYSTMPKKQDADFYSFFYNFLQGLQKSEIDFELQQVFY